MNISIPDFQDELHQLLKTLNEHKNKAEKYQMLAVLSLLVGGTLICYLYALCKLFMNRGDSFVNAANVANLATVRTYERQESAQALDTTVIGKTPDTEGGIETTGVSTIRYDMIIVRDSSDGLVEVEEQAETAV